MTIRSAAHYIFTGSTLLTKAVVAYNEEHKILSVSENDAMAIEYSNTIFYNGLICPAFISAPADTPGKLWKIDQDGVPDSLPDFIHYNETNITPLFAALETLQKKGKNITELLTILCVNNYRANNLNPIFLEPGNTCHLVLLKKLDLFLPGFTHKTSYRNL